MAEGIIQRAASLKEQVAEAVLALLHTGHLVPGTRVTEEGLARELNVSRTPIREALGQLAQRGVLQARPRGGYLVPLPSDQEIRDAIAVRMLLEPPAARMAAEEFNEAQIEAVNRAIQGESDSAGERDPARFAHANEAFRKAVFDQLSNRALRDAIGQFNGHLHFIRATTLKNLNLRKEILARQQRIRDAISQHDAEMAEALWRSYLRLTEDALLAALHHYRNVRPQDKVAAGAR